MTLTVKKGKPTCVFVEWLFPFFYFCCKKETEVFWPAFGQILENCWCLNHLWSRKFCRENPDSKIAHCIPFICIIKRVESSFSKMTFIFHLRMKFKFSTLQQTIQKLAKTRKKFRKIEKKKEIPKWWFFENLKLAVKQCYQTKIGGNAKIEILKLWYKNIAASEAVEATAIYRVSQQVRCLNQIIPIFSPEQKLFYEKILVVF